MAAALIVATTFLPIPEGTQSFTLRDDEVYYSLAGAQSFAFFNQVISKGRTYRDTLSAGDIGRAWPDSVADYAASQDDRFTHNALRDGITTVTFMAFFDGQTGSGNVVALCPAYLFEQFSPSAPTRY